MTVVFRANRVSNVVCSISDIVAVQSDFQIMIRNRIRIMELLIVSFDLSPTGYDFGYIAYTIMRCSLSADESKPAEASVYHRTLA